MEDDIKIGECDICDTCNVKVLYSYTLDQWLCESCFDISADLIWYGDE